MLGRRLPKAVNWAWSGAAFNFPSAVKAVLTTNPSGSSSNFFSAPDKLPALSLPMTSAAAARTRQRGSARHNFKPAVMFGGQRHWLVRAVRLHFLQGR